MTDDLDIEVEKIEAEIADRKRHLFKLQRNREWRRRNRQRVREEMRNFKVGNSVTTKARDEMLRDGVKRLAEIPADTRDLTGWLMGDPIPNDPRRSQLPLVRLK